MIDVLFRNVREFTASGFQPRVAIVGTGPAGLSLALRLRQRSVPCLLIEAGGYEHDDASQNLYRGTVVGDHYFELHEARLRQFGGTSGHWTGWCRPLDSVDFEPRPSIANSGWPIRKSDLDPYAAATSELLQAPSVADDRPLTPELDRIAISFSPAVRFGSTFRTSIEGSRTTGLLLNSAVTEFVPGSGRIDALRVVEAGSAPQNMPAPIVCLCTGGIENSRLLLWSNARHGGRVVPGAQTLGRYWMEHPSLIVGDALLFDDAHPLLRPTNFFAPSAAALRTHAIGSAQMWLRHPPERSNRAKQLAQQILCVAPALSSRLLEMSGRELWCGREVHMESEQIPLPDNRIELGRDVDALGIPRVCLHWRKSATDRHTARVALQLLGEALIRHDLGRVRVSNWLLDGADWSAYGQGAGRHHMGGTRMAQSPASGVVDRDCKVFGMSNLYVAGSSVFPTSGHANPTYTIVQLALRLADHLAAATPHARA